MTDWPNWTGKKVAIIASGPSAKSANVDLLRGRLPVLAIKKNVELAPWADVVYGCDGPWWRSVQGLMKFNGLKLSHDAGVCGSEYGIQRVTIDDPKSNQLLFGEIGKVGAGGNSGFQALNLTLQFGASGILLVAFDVHGRSGEHWYGRNNWAMANNPTNDNYRRWLRAFEGAAKDIAARGVEVINASMASDLQCFRKMSVADALTCWSLRDAA